MYSRAIQNVRCVTDIIYYNCVSRGRRAIIEKFQVITREQAEQARARQLRTQSQLETEISPSMNPSARRECVLLYRTTQTERKFALRQKIYFSKSSLS